MIFRWPILFSAVYFGPPKIKVGAAENFWAAKNKVIFGGFDSLGH
jgi:hypothetical protein